MNKPFDVLKTLQLTVGTVVHRDCTDILIDKEKFVVVVSLAPRLLVLIINSHINPFFYIKGTDKFHVPVPKDTHPFLKHISYVNCVQAHQAHDLTQFKEEFIKDYAKCFKGYLDDNCLTKVYEAVKTNTVIITGHQKEIMASIEGKLPHLREPSK